MANGIYVCALCGSSHNDIEERIACETKCLKKRKEEEARAAREAERKVAEKIKKQKAESEKAIEAELAKVNEMISKHCTKYGGCALSEDYACLALLFSQPTMWWF